MNQKSESGLEQMGMKDVDKISFDILRKLDDLRFDINDIKCELKNPYFVKEDLPFAIEVLGNVIIDLQKTDILLKKIREILLKEVAEKQLSTARFAEEPKEEVPLEHKKG
jgi:hypothetical protein